MKKQNKLHYLFCRNCRVKFPVPRLIGLCTDCSLKINNRKNYKGANLNEF